LAALLVVACLSVTAALIDAGPATAAPDGSAVATRTVKVGGQTMTIVASSTAEADAIAAKVATVSAQTGVEPLDREVCYALALICLFEHADARGSELTFSASDFQRRSLYNLTEYAFNDKMTSWENASDITVSWCVDVNHGGGCHVMLPSGRNIQNVYPIENDKASSIVLGWWWT
jgi:hypothetical protein